jgi:hypothetical protein
LKLVFEIRNVMVPSRGARRWKRALPYLSVSFDLLLTPAPHTVTLAPLIARRVDASFTEIVSVRESPWTSLPRTEDLIFRFVTTDVGFDVAEPAPAEFVAVTTTRMVEPTSAGTSL